MKYGLFLILTAGLVGCGSNPEKDYVGMDIQENFLTTTAGEYQGPNGTGLKITPAGEFQFTQSKNFALQLNAPTNFGNFDIIVDGQHRGTVYKSDLDTALEKAVVENKEKTLSFTCHAQVAGAIESVFAIPKSKSEDLNMAWELENAKQVDPKASHAIFFNEALPSRPDVLSPTLSSDQASLDSWGNLKRKLEQECNRWGQDIPSPAYSEFVTVRAFDKKGIRLGRFKENSYQDSLGKTFTEDELSNLGLESANYVKR